MKCMIHARIYDFEQYIEDGYIFFDKFILEVGEMSKFRGTDLEIIDCKGDLVIPGLVCGHTHLYSAFARGLALPFNPQNFQEILDQLWWKLDGVLDLDMVYHSGLAFASDFLKNGVTTIIDHHASGEISGSLEMLKKAVVDKAHLRGVFCFETSDRFDTSKCIDENNQFIKNHQDEDARGLFGLHASMSLSDDTLFRVENETNAPLHIHIAESLMDEEDSIKKHHKRIVTRLNDFGLLRKDSLFVHGVHLSDKEMDLIKENDITIAVCVSSNMNNGVGLPNVTKFLDKKISCIIGNDGLSPAMANEYLALYYTMHLDKKSPTAFSLDDLRKMILSTYEYAGNKLGITLGKIKKGAASDLLILPYTSATEINKDNIFGHLFFGCFHSFKPKNVYIRGVEELKDYQISATLKEEQIHSLASSQRCWKKLKKEGIR